MKWLALAAPLAAALLLGCDDSVSGFLSCGIDVCSAREVCAETASGPACVCAEGFEGSACSACSSGYRRNGPNDCQLIPIDCDEDATVCGLHGACVTESGVDSCQCDELYAGRLCELCEPGYQDNDSDGTCRATCEKANLACKAPSRCSDAHGTAVCECPVGYSGDDCSRCALGYRDNGKACVATCAASTIACSPSQTCVDGPMGARCECAPGYAGPNCDACADGYREDESTGSCLPSCEGLEASCGAHGRCDDSVGFARCVCDLGYRGAACDDCADEFEANGEECERSLSEGETLVMIANYQARSVIATIDASTGAARPLLEAAPAGLAGAEPRALFVNRAGTISRVTAPEGASTVSVPNSGAVGPLAWDAAGKRLYALSGKPPYRVLSIDPATKVVIELFDTGLAGAADLAFDAAQNRLLVLRDTLFAVSLTDGAVSSLGALPPASLGVEVGEDGALLAVAATDADEATSRVQACRTTAALLGIEGYSGATGRFLQPAGDLGSVELTTATDDAPELLSYLGRGATGLPRVIDVAVQNPEAVLCLALEEASRVRIADDAQFRALVLYAADHDVELITEVEEAASARIFLGGYAATFTHPEREDLVVYTPQEWSSLKLPLDMRFHQPGPGVMYTLTGELGVEQVTTLSGGAIPAGALSVWSPQPP
jgi:hypothetical protein